MSTRDRGAATMWTVSAIAVVTTLMLVVLWIGAAIVTRHRAAGAADLAALAAAGAAPSGERAACDRARWVAERMAVELRSCRLVGWDALVEVVAVPPGVLSEFGSAAARARAGPVTGSLAASSTVVHAR